MKDETVKQFNTVLGQMAKQYGQRTLAHKFNVSPTIAQKLQDKINEQSTFLKKVNIVPVDELEGQNVLAGIDTPIAGRTNTDANKRREPRQVLSLAARRYKLAPTESDIAISFGTLDAWARFRDLYKRYAGYVSQRLANDRELVGWYGTSLARDTDRNANPLLEDVNIGWMQYIRETLPVNIISEGAVKGEVRIGADGDFLSLDHAISDLLTGIPLYMRSNLVALVGGDLISAEKQALYKAFGQHPSEKNQLLSSLTSFGGVSSWETPSNFPARALVITGYKNLSVYYQSDSWRRSIRREDEYNRYADYQSRNEGYTVETPEKFVALEFNNVKLSDGKGGWI